GLLGFGFARTFGEPSVDRAIAFEESHEHKDAPMAMPQDAKAAKTDNADASHDHGGEELVSRPTQAGIGLLTGVCVFGTALGGIFSLVFGFAYGRIGGALHARGAAALLALLGFISVAIGPFLKYPPNPPAIGNPDTIGPRTALFFIMIAISILAMVFAVWLQRRLQPTQGGFNATLIGAAVYIVVIAIALFALPTIDEVPADFSASLLWRFRITSVGIQAIIWTTLGLVFGAFASRELERRPARRMAAA
ncbi:CbtA family protein, partial [Caballeronia sp. BR00000012568055]|uniref:CbtA family protein n=1 Tax=Caballeronia sp. BR00000012568055 TaxID=2918761 RepID=UPI0023F6AC37